MSSILDYNNFLGAKNTDEALKTSVTEQDADKFIADVLKLGSKSNLFDNFLKKEKISPDELSILVSLVGKRLQTKWGGL
jgi:hypothetical protein